jgi:hypothetical protein
MGPLDEPGAALMRAPHASRKVTRIAAALSMTLLLSAHVGSPDVYSSGRAGPYAIDVAIRPPSVVPGIADVLVRVADPTVTRVVVRPVFWRAGSKGAPTGDDARRVPDAPGTYTGQLWLMAGGAYSVHVTVTGPAGTGTLVVPVGAMATGQLSLGPSMTWLLSILGFLLLAGLVTVVRAAVGEGQVPPGEQIPPARRRRARVATLIMVPVAAFIVLGGARWWRAEASDYRRRMYRSPSTRASVRDSLDIRVLTLSVTDSAWRAGGVTAVMPDHGKLAHLFVVRADSLDVFAHLHPTMPDRSTFVVALPPLPAGRYRLFNDIVHESGFERTLVDSFTIATTSPRATPQPLDPDDAWFVGPATQVSSSALESSLGDGISISWAGDARPLVGHAGALRFILRDTAGGPVNVEPYLGMHGHAVVMRRDGKVFVHLHPSGTASMASQMAFALRDRGDTTAQGRLRLDGAPMATASAGPLREIAFPYAFPSAGAYRVWVQLRSAGRVRTAAFDVSVGAPLAR